MEESQQIEKRNLASDLIKYSVIEINLQPTLEIGLIEIKISSKYLA